MITAKKMGVKTKKSKQKGLKADVLRQIKNDDALISKIIFASGKSYPTVMRWLTQNSILLTQAACLNVICAELNLTQTEVLSGN